MPESATPTIDQTAAESVTEPTQPNGTSPSSTPSFTQADVDRIVSRRVAALQEKADAYDRQVEATKSEAQKQAEKIAELESKLAAVETSNARRKAALDAGLVGEAVDLVTGDTPDEIAASVKKLTDLIGQVTATQKPAPDKSQGRTGVNARLGSVAAAREKYASRFTKQG
jgi:hypothetical protein